MGVFAGPEITESGLVLALDAGNSKSYPGSGTTWFDLSGNGRNATLFNSPTFDSNNGGSFIFDGVDDWARATDNGIGTGSTLPHSIEMWVNFNVLTSTRWWLAVLGQFGTGSHHWIGASPTATQFGAWSANCQRSPNLIGTNNWLHITSSYDGTNLILYVNNTATASCVADGFNFTNSDFTIGLRIGSEDFFNGKVSIARLYNRALTAQEIQQNFIATRSRFSI